jgi:glycosyltransferase involved in cell wall biosynthesis
MARIAILNAGHMDYVGTERVVACQARGLYALGHQVVIFTPVNDKRIFADVIPKAVQIKSWWHTLPAPMLKRTINRLIHFWFGGKELKNFDVLIAHNQPAPYVAYKNKMQNAKPYIVYCHAPWRRLYPRKVDLVSGWALDYREKIMFLRQDYWRRIDSASISGADALLINSLKTKEEVKHVYGVEAKVCYPGIDISKYRDFPRDEVDKVSKKYQIKENTLLVVGRHAPQKMLEWVPEIVKKVAPRSSQVEVIITGKPNRLVTQKLVEAAKQLGVETRIRMIGAVPENELISLYYSCPVLLYTAVSEDFGLPPVEAMTCGCIPVAWNEGAGPCETIIDGETGLLARPYDLDDFAGKVLRLLENPGERALISKKGIARAAKYSWSLHLNILDETISRVVE